MNLSAYQNARYKMKGFTAEQPFSIYEWNAAPHGVLPRDYRHGRLQCVDGLRIIISMNGVFIW